MLTLVALHLDFWRVQRVELYFGWLPEELAWRLAWTLLAWVFLLWFCAPGRDATAEGEDT